MYLIPYAMESCCGVQVELIGIEVEVVFRLICIGRGLGSRSLSPKGRAFCVISAIPLFVCLSRR